MPAQGEPAERWLEEEGLVVGPGPGAIADVARVRAILVNAATRGEAISYSALLLALGHRFTRPKMRALCRTLDAIDREGEAAGEPALAVLVVREADGLPGQGWWTAMAGRGHTGAWIGPEARSHVAAQQSIAFHFWQGR